MRKSVGQLDALSPVDPERLAVDPTSGLVIERILALLVDLAFEINRLVSAVVLGDLPKTPAASFGAAEQAGMIDAQLATALAPADGPHNVLLQLYLDSAPEEVAAVVSGAVSGYREYVRQVGCWASAQSPEG